MTLALLCSGQGRQHPGMFDLTAEAPEAQRIFDAATCVLGGVDPRMLVRQAGVALDTNIVAQILCCTQALAAHAALSGAIGSDVVLAGYSVGELAAWGCAGMFSPEVTLGLARRRAELMDEVGGREDGLAFVRGLAEGQVEAICLEVGAAIAIVNPAKSYVVGGDRTRLRSFCERALASGAARTGLLAVHVASHTPRLGAASIAFLAELRAAHPAPAIPAGLRLLSGAGGEAVTTVREGIEMLALQMSRTVRWADCLDACREAGASAVLELGPGRALAEMWTATHPTVRARSADDFRTLDGLRTWVAKVE